MRQFNILCNTEGFAKAYKVALKWRHMYNKQEVKRRVEALQFWDTHGLKAAMDHAKVSKRTLQRWRASLNVAGGNCVSLDPHSTAPKQRRQRIIPIDLEERIIRYRTTYQTHPCLLYTSPSPRDRTRSRMPSSA